MPSAINKTDVVSEAESITSEKMLVVCGDDSCAKGCLYYQLWKTLRVFWGSLF